MTLGSGEDEVTAIISDGSYLYAGMGTTPGKVIRINSGTFTKVSTVTFDTNDDWSNTLCLDGAYIYSGLGTSPGKVIKVDLNTMSIVSTITFDTNDDVIHALFTDGSYLYAALETTPGKVVRINLSTFVKVSPIILAAGENDAYSLFSDNTYLYTGLYTSPGKIVRRYIIPSPSVLEKKANLVHEQISNEFTSVYPTLAAAVFVLSSAVAWTQGNYAEVVPVNTIKTGFFITGIVINNMVIDSEYEVDIATGAGGSEVVIATVTHETNDTNLSSVIPINPPIKIPSNTRVSTRCATENAAGDTCTIKVMYKQ